jgi:hypothetical protein
LFALLYVSPPWLGSYSWVVAFTFSCFFGGTSVFICFVVLVDYCLAGIGAACTSFLTISYTSSSGLIACFVFLLD